MKTLRGYKWSLKEPDERIVLNLVQKLEISNILAKVLVNRNICSVEEAKRFLDPTLATHMPDPFLLQDMATGVTRIVRAIRDGEKITIFADYDVDGATSAAVFRKFFKSIGVDVEIYVPHRIREGYGPNSEAFKAIKNNGTDLVITVDCGIVAFEPLFVAKECGLDVIVVDHHISLKDLPEAVAVINPNRLDDDFQCKSIAAVGVVFFVVAAIRKHLRDIRWFTTAGVQEPNLLELLDLVALGTVCDVMPLVGLNRVFVRYGLNLIAKRKNCGFNALIKMSKIDIRITSSHLGYVIGPRINAGGRVGEGTLGALLLSMDDKLEAEQIAEHLEKLNNERRDIEVLMMQEAMAQIKSIDIQNHPVIMVQSANWHFGILGILASKLKDIYCKPIIVASIDGNGFAKGSIRSIVGLDIGGAILDAKAHGLITEGGGHPMAGGFITKVENLQNFHDFLNERFKIIFFNGSVFDDARVLNVDSVIDIQAFNGKLIAEIDRAAPFGMGNQMPKFIIKDLVLRNAYAVKGDNVIAFVEDRYKKFVNSNNANYINDTLKLIAFRAAKTELGEFLLKNKGAIIDVVGTQQQNFLDKNKVEMIVDDIAVIE